jgi:hypothetical protein
LKARYAQVGFGGVLGAVSVFMIICGTHFYWCPDRREGGGGKNAVSGETA